MATSALTEFDAERDRLAMLTRKGIGMPAAGLLYWVVFAVFVRVLPPKTALMYSFFLTGAVFPGGMMLTRAAGGDLFAKSQSLTPLGLMLAAVQLFYWPVIVVVFTQAREWTPFAMAVLFSSHFLPYAWLYRSRGYAVLAIAPTVMLIVGAIVTRGPMFTMAPVLTATCYAIALGMLGREVAASVKDVDTV